MEVNISFEKKDLHFSDPTSIIECRDPLKLSSAFQNIEEQIKKGYYAAGFISYEAGHYFEERLREKSVHDFPLIMMGIYKGPHRGTRKRSVAGGFEVRDLTINTTKEEYQRNIEKIRHYISIGDVYQITYCIKMKFDFFGDARSFHKSLYDAQPVPYSAFIDAGPFKILSLSPERFIKKRGTDILSEPMKGTWWRGSNIISDLIERRRFSRDIKNRAENVMIADLLRNDLGRVGLNIRAPKLFTIAGYRTLYQMTSTVTGDVRRDLGLFELFSALFPSGSVTGAPKIRAMEIIRDIEKEERRIYTGAIGYITPARDMYFNIPIRTILLRGSVGEMGIGGGIVWDSTPDGEWNEGLLKARFLSDRFA